MVKVCHWQGSQFCEHLDYSRHTLPVQHMTPAALRFLVDSKSHLPKCHPSLVGKTSAKKNTKKNNVHLNTVTFVMDPGQGDSALNILVQSGQLRCFKML